jgi:hypothetical protein
MARKRRTASMPAEKLLAMEPILRQGAPPGSRPDAKGRVWFRRDGLVGSVELRFRDDAGDHYINTVRYR